jgi:hypothetical protein
MDAGLRFPVIENLFGFRISENEIPSGQQTQDNHNYEIHFDLNPARNHKITYFLIMDDCGANRHTHECGHILTWMSMPKVQNHIFSQHFCKANSVKLTYCFHQQPVICNDSN